ncbi:MAG: hypothetical protein HZB54_04185 [Deltaproteobacteria bacterium]|nr:hypothetical protein [Deltaproteobacteria bacterium]
MKQITLRDIPYEIERLIKREASEKGLSLNKAFLSLLEKATGIKVKEKKKKAIYHDLDRLSGIWTKNDAVAFEKNLELQRKIDEGLWKKAG